MNQYLFQLSYTSDAWKQLVRNPENRGEAIRPVVRQLNGEILASWVTMGDFDLLMVIRLPDEVSAAAVLMAFKGGGALRQGQFVRLLSWTEALDAMAKAGACGYRSIGEYED